MKWMLILILALLVLAAVLLLAGCGKGQIMDGPGMIQPDPADRPANTAQPEAETVLELHSFDGGGPEYDLVFADESLVRVERRVEYGKPDHAELDGAGYDVIYSFYGLKAGETRMTLQARSPIGGNCDTVYRVTVDEQLHVALEELYTEDLDAGAHAEKPNLAIVFGDRTVYASFADTAAAEHLIELLYSTSYGMYFREHGGFAVSAMLGEDFPLEDEELSVTAGDVVLLAGEGEEQGETLFCICYAEQTVTGTRIGRVDGLSAEDWQALLAAAPREGDYLIGEMWTEYPE